MIVLLKEGQVIEHDTPSNLLSYNSVFASMVHDDSDKWWRYTLDPAFIELSYNEHPAIASHFFSRKRTLVIDISSLKSLVTMSTTYEEQVFVNWVACYKRDPMYLAFEIRICNVYIKILWS